MPTNEEIQIVCDLASKAKDDCYRAIMRAIDLAPLQLSAHITLVVEAAAAPLGILAYLASGDRARDQKAGADTSTVAKYVSPDGLLFAALLIAKHNSDAEMRIETTTEALFRTAHARFKTITGRDFTSAFTVAGGCNCPKCQAERARRAAAH